VGQSARPRPEPRPKAGWGRVPGTVLSAKFRAKSLCRVRGKIRAGKMRVEGGAGCLR